jgi:hypothetical protein
MLSVSQLRTIQWSRETSQLDSVQMLAVANTMLNSPPFWTSLEEGQIRSDHVVDDGRAYLIVYVCLTAEDEILLEILQVQ